jgi:hypothetical protein
MAEIGPLFRPIACPCNSRAPGPLLNPSLDFPRGFMYLLEESGREKSPSLQTESLCDLLVVIMMPHRVGFLSRCPGFVDGV